MTILLVKGKRKILGTIYFIWVFLCDSAGKEPACNAGDAGSVPGLGRLPVEGNGTHSSILAWEIPWTEENDGL